jgi:GNAT superfamily N-acetyltransferase
VIPAAVVTQRVHLPDGGTQVVRHTSELSHAPAAPGPAGPRPASPVSPSGPTRDIPLGRLCGARSGDKGGAANVGLWAVSPETYAWLRGYLTVDRLRSLLPEAAGLQIDHYELPNLRAVNFVIHGLLAPGVSATTRPDAQAKGLGEYLRSRIVQVPVGLAGIGEIPRPAR